jgi:hypothetical protein
MGGDGCVKSTNLAPDMRSVLVDQGLSRISTEELRNDQKSDGCMSRVREAAGTNVPDIFFAVQCLLQDVTSITVGGKLDDSAPWKRSGKMSMEKGQHTSCMQQSSCALLVFQQPPNSAERPSYQTWS